MNKMVIRNQKMTQMTMNQLYKSTWISYLYDLIKKHREHEYV